MPMNKLIRPITKQVIAPNTLFIFGKIATKNKTKNNIWRPIPILMNYEPSNHSSTFFILIEIFTLHNI